MLRYLVLSGIALAIGLGFVAAPYAGQAQTPAGDAKQRTFLFTYSATLTKVPSGKTARIWIPVPTSTVEQNVEIASKQLPGKEQLGKEALYGNQMLYCEAQPNADGKISLTVTYRVTRKEVRSTAQGYKKPGAEEKIKRFLEADQKVPIDGKPLELIKDQKLPKDHYEIGKYLYDVVNNHMKYSKHGTGWGQGDSVWACDSKYGNCSDFHSLFISLTRAHKIPAKFEMGFPIPDKRGEGAVGGYHCWAWFLPEGKGWVPVDISEANREPKMKEYYFGNLTENRVTFSTGRDIDLVPRQAAGPLNFFIYPYVEVDGKAYPADQIERTFAYRDVAGK
jgi:transglutaminase-like putative cysteine protease